MSTTSLVHKHAHAILKDISQDQRQFRFIATRHEVDRDGEVIDPKGLNVQDFKKNPVLLLLHDPNRPIGRVMSLTLSVVDGALAWTGVARIDPPGTSADADQAYRQRSAGSLNGISIGFRVWESSPRAVLPGQTGPTLTKTTLLEVSLVTVPSCANCLVLEKTLRKEISMSECTCQKQEIDWDAINRPLSNKVEVNVTADDVQLVVKHLMPLYRSALRASLTAPIRAAVERALCRLTGRLD